MQYPLMLRSKWKMPQRFVKKSEVRMSRYLETSTGAQMAQIVVQNGRPSRSSRKQSVRSSFDRTAMGKAI